MTREKWVGVDLDGTLTRGFSGGDSVGEPVPEMVALVKDLMARGLTVKIFTARVNTLRSHEMVKWNIEQQVCLITAWCIEHFGEPLEITCEKDFCCMAILDDRAITVQHGTGKILTDIDGIGRDLFLPEALRRALGGKEQLYT